MCGTTYSLLQSSNTLNYRRMITHGASEFVYRTTKCRLKVWVVWLSLRRAKEQTRPIRFENFRIGRSLSSRIESDGRFEFESNLEASQVPTSRTLGPTFTNSVQ